MCVLLSNAWRGCGRKKKKGRGSFDGVIALRWHIDDGSLAAVKLFIYIRGTESKNKRVSFFIIIIIFEERKPAYTFINHPKWRSIHKVVHYKP